MDWFKDFIFAPFWTTAGGGAVIAATIALITLAVNQVIEHKKRQHDAKEKQKDREATRQDFLYKVKIEERTTNHSILETVGELAQRAMDSLVRYETGSLAADYMEASSKYPEMDENLQKSLKSIKKDTCEAWETVKSTQEKLKEKHSQLKMRDINAADIGLEIKTVVDNAVDATNRSERFPGLTEDLSAALTEYSRKVREYKDSPIT